MKQNIGVHALVVIVLLLAGIGAAETPNRVTILYDSYGKNPSLTNGEPMERTEKPVRQWLTIGSIYG